MVGKSGCGKTTLSQRLMGEEIQYQKTQSIQLVGNGIVDTPGEYLERKQFYNALTVTAVEADIILLLISATDDQNVFSPGMNTMFGGKPAIGVVTKTDLCGDRERIRQAEELLCLAGAKEVFETGLNDPDGLEKLKKRIERG